MQSNRYGWRIADLLHHGLIVLKKAGIEDRVEHRVGAGKRVQLARGKVFGTLLIVRLKHVFARETGMVPAAQVPLVERELDLAATAGLVQDVENAEE